MSRRSAITRWTAARSSSRVAPAARIGARARRHARRRSRPGSAVGRGAPGGHRGRQGYRPVSRASRMARSAWRREEPGVSPGRSRHCDRGANPTRATGPRTREGRGSEDPGVRTLDRRGSFGCTGRSIPRTVRVLRRLLLVRHAPTAATRAAAFPLDERSTSAPSPRPARLVDDVPGAARGAARARRCVASRRRGRPGLDPVVEPALAECDFGEWGGRTLEEVCRRGPERRPRPG